MSPVSDEQISAFHEDGFLIVPGLFDSEEADILRKAAHTDSSFGENAYDLEDGEGGKAQLVLWNKAGEDLWGAIARSEHHQAPQYQRIHSAAESRDRGAPSTRVRHPGLPQRTRKRC